MNTRAAMLPVLCALLMLTACAKAPTEQIAAAEKAVTEAQQSGAATYVADEYAKIEGTMAALKKEVSEQDGKFASAKPKPCADRIRTLDARLWINRSN